MLNYDELQAPIEDCGILVAPTPADCAKALRLNHEQLANANGRVLGRPLSHWRELARRQFGVRNDEPLVVTGHQPAFLHAGVWAKNVVASRLSDAVGGRAVNLVVDNDAPDYAMLDVPEVVAGRLRLRRIAFAEAVNGRAYEQIPVQTPGTVDAFESQVRAAMGEAYERSAMPEYLNGFKAADPAGDWVNQAVAGRRAVDALYGVGLKDHRVSRLWWAPMLWELIREAPRFAAAYNRSLAEYRRERRVRGVGQPVPDLVDEADLSEIPIWAYRKGEARQRVGVRRRDRRFALIVKGESILEFAEDDLTAEAESVETGGWMLRPRALTLTLWARLFAADLFVHGVGGAKYDRITDAIIRDYFGMEPPRIACVSATLRWRLDAATNSSSRSTSGRLGKGGRPQLVLDWVRHEIRDVQWNPQRHVSDGREVAALVERRAREVARSTALREQNPRDRHARREVFHSIRELNRQLLAVRPNVLEEKSRGLSEAKELVEQHRIAAGREYFFALHDRADLARLVNALPGAEDFRL